jgi:hypothetical protein
VFQNTLAYFRTICYSDRATVNHDTITQAIVNRDTSPVSRCPSGADPVRHAAIGCNERPVGALFLELAAISIRLHLVQRVVPIWDS